MEVQITIKNLAKLRSAFNKSPRIMGHEFEQAIKKSGFLVEGKSMINSPVRTGLLRMTHRVDFSGTGVKFKAEIMAMVNYAVFVHEGTRFMRARPFLRNAMESAEGTVQGIFREHVRRGLRAIGELT